MTVRGTSYEVRSTWLSLPNSSSTPSTLGVRATAPHFWSAAIRLFTGRCVVELHPTLPPAPQLQLQVPLHKHLPGLFPPSRVKNPARPALCLISSLSFVTKKARSCFFFSSSLLLPFIAFLSPPVPLDSRCVHPCWPPKLPAPDPPVVVQRPSALTPLIGELVGPRAPLDVARRDQASTTDTSRPIFVKRRKLKAPAGLVSTITLPAPPRTRLLL